MKYSISVLAVVGVVLAFDSGNTFAKGNNNTGSTSAPSYAGGHHSSSPATPRFSGTPHFSGTNSYHPQINYSSGSRTLNYPAVHNSVIRQQFYSKPSNFAGRKGPQSDVNPVLRQRSSTLNNLNNAYALQRSGNLRTPTNISQGAHLKATTINHGPKLDPQTSTRLRNWNGERSTTQQAHLNHLNNCQHHHDHWWWRHHCVALIFFDFGWWGWYDGWWYPAWGYDPYSYYDYNEPIYGYDGESPEQIVAGVQAALQERGYYQYAIDGRMGPITRAALARFQSDHGLPVTSGIDPATLGSLGIIR